MLPVIRMGAVVSSQPARAVWIEIWIAWSSIVRPASHSLRGLCGLKSVIVTNLDITFRHSLRGLCGLKLFIGVLHVVQLLSQPARAVWIEIPSSAPVSCSL